MRAILSGIIFTLLLLPAGAAFIPAPAGAGEYRSVESLLGGRPGVKKPAPQKNEAAPARTRSAPANRAAAPHRAAPPQEPAPAAASVRPASGRVNLFGTVEFRRPLNTLPGWLATIKRNENNQIFNPGKLYKKNAGWDSLKNSASGKPPREQLRIVNSFWNSWPYREDIVNWGQEDYWEAPYEFLKKSGDCEDYAIIKYFTLKELGFDPDKMRIVVLRDTIRNLAHAVLAVYIDGDAFILDNLSDVVLSHRRLGNYMPQYSVNEKGRWAHIKGKKSASR